MVSNIFSVMHGTILPIDELIFFKMVIAPPTSYVLWPTMKHYQPLLTTIVVQRFFAGLNVSRSPCRDERSKNGRKRGGSTETWADDPRGLYDRGEILEYKVGPTWMGMFSKNGGWIWGFIGFDGIGLVFSNFTMVYDTQITIVFMGFINQFITGGATLYRLWFISHIQVGIFTYINLYIYII